VSSLFSCYVFHLYACLFSSLVAFREPWNPKTSNITQVLKSILFLIFTEEPYFNEPGYDRSDKGYHLPSLQYDYEVMQNNLRFAVTYHLQQSESRYGVEILNYVKEYYQNNWRSGYRLEANLKSKIPVYCSNLRKKPEELLTLLNKASVLIPVHEGEERGNNVIDLDKEIDEEEGKQKRKRRKTRRSASALENDQNEIQVQFVSSNINERNDADNVICLL
jgi:hypothetical protein